MVLLTGRNKKWWRKDCHLYNNKVRVYVSPLHDDSLRDTHIHVHCSLMSSVTYNMIWRSSGVSLICPSQFCTSAKKFYICSVSGSYWSPVIQIQKAKYEKLWVSYDDALNVLLGNLRSCRANDMFCNAYIRTFVSLMRSLMYECTCHLMLQY